MLDQEYSYILKNRGVKKKKERKIVVLWGNIRENIRNDKVLIQYHVINHNVKEYKKIYIHYTHTYIHIYTM